MTIGLSYRRLKCYLMKNIKRRIYKVRIFVGKNLLIHSKTLVRLTNFAPSPYEGVSDIH